MVTPKALKRVLKQVREGRRTAAYFRLIGEVMICARCGCMVNDGAREHHRLWHEYWEGEKEIWEMMEAQRRQKDAG